MNTDTDNTNLKKKWLYKDYSSINGLKNQCECLKTQLNSTGSVLRTSLKAESSWFSLILLINIKAVFFFDHFWIHLNDLKHGNFLMKKNHLCTFNLNALIKSISRSGSVSLFAQNLARLLDGVFIVIMFSLASSLNAVITIYSFSGLWLHLSAFCFVGYCSARHREAARIKVFSLFSTLVCINLVAHSKKPPSTTNLIPVFEIERGTWLNSSLLFLPLCSFFSDWMCFIYSCGGCGGREKKGGTRRSGREGTMAQVVMMKGVFHSLTLPVVPLFSCLRHLIKWAWIVDVTLSVSPPPRPPFFLVSHPHTLPCFPPSPSVLTLSSIYLQPQASIHPFTLSQCCSVTTDRRPD